MSTKVVCPSCAGEGQVGLSVELQQVFDEFEPGQILMVSQVRERILKKHKMDVLHTAINNRLEALRGYGLLTREKAGRNWLYQLASRE